mmetsp:Transcript_112968/g.319499  ORF Transcript_112968/g.319499 Transcript_112968/m.319499 type:complete len:446 (-) Transcript_112968:93-1430(-)
MVEGHSCHRVATQHRKRLVGRRFQATSPNGRFVDGASAIEGLELRRIEVHGKNLFYFFGGKHVVHVHFGMSGAFRLHARAKAPEPGSTTRLRLMDVEGDLEAQLSAMTVELISEDAYKKKAAELGPDPLREDADKERFWTRWQQTKRCVGLLLMDQSFVAGVGNIFRAEILFKAAVNPLQPADTAPREVFERVWRHTVECLQMGFKSGSISTVDPAEAKVLGRPWTRRYVYNQEACGRCGSSVVSWLMATRRVYYCPTCQPLLPGTAPGSGPKKALIKFRRARIFPPPPSAAAPPGHRARFRRLRLSSAAEATPGTAHLAEAAATPAEAALEKLMASEGRNVEHVAELDDPMQEVIDEAEIAKMRRKRLQPRRPPAHKRGRSGVEASSATPRQHRRAPRLTPSPLPSRARRARGAAADQRPVPGRAAKFSRLQEAPVGRVMQVLD